MVDLCRKSHSLSDAERSNTTAQLNEHIAMVSRDAVRDILGHNGPPTTQQVRIQKHCIPQYQLGHLERMGEIDWLLRATTKGCVSVLGSSYRGVSVNDCVRFAKNTAKGLAQGKMVTGLSDV
ncbi:hypothetical protein SARC_03666 [Sphaeroforma arctica JP610]|uniref:Uncharacterized protein n=1 Tax=Sphaeroforma arctica JP610 TaxID=667725 RepID=A0A0L0G5L8_9EUKA|nr:hypothetical protein SARC_03666 [Sphaeroforma arctica JP610]KNC84101.1 hypothetical protein SARC_03666 [Sphaeroforma arctica JP610]|eukprot:XP_014158003.1 hypothetical protein SARC_03666 [Sphaeroforma arctica JP610]